jgi:hypothetical protein
MGERDRRWSGTRRLPSSRLLRCRLPISATENESLAMECKDHRLPMRPVYSEGTLIKAAFACEQATRHRHPPDTTPAFAAEP